MLALGLGNYCLFPRERNGTGTGEEYLKSTPVLLTIYILNMYSTCACTYIWEVSRSRTQPLLISGTYFRCCTSTQVAPNLERTEIGHADTSPVRLLFSKKRAVRRGWHNMPICRFWWKWEMPIVDRILFWEVVGCCLLAACLLRLFLIVLVTFSAWRNETMSARSRSTPTYHLSKQDFN